VGRDTDEMQPCWRHVHRLARNRAAARLRRQRKKNLVETYEQEVASLEANLKKLQAHAWGNADGTLEEALGKHHRLCLQVYIWLFATARA
jgi:hypothetical protein